MVIGATDPRHMSLPEATQWVMRLGGGRLRFAWVEAGAAALIDLTLAGRIDSLPNRGFFNQEDQRRLIVTDPTPLGVRELDRALEMLVAHGKPRRIKRWIWDIGRSVSDIVRADAVGAGLVEEVGKFPSLTGYLRVLDDSRQRLAVEMLEGARRLPDRVTDPRAGALVDLMRNGSVPFRGEAARGEEIEHEWYPAGTRATVNGLLWAERVRTASGGIY